MIDDNGEWFLRGHAIASVAFNDPVWAEQTYQMDRGERRRGDYDPPIPSEAIDALRDRQRRLNAIEDLMAAQGRADIPSAEESAAWVQLDRSQLLAGRALDRHGIRWVPATLVAEFDALRATPLPSSAELRHCRRRRRRFRVGAIPFPAGRPQ